MSVESSEQTDTPTAGFCVNHPTEPARLRCTKHSKPLCRMCVVCQDPTIYCKFRTECVVWEIEKQRKRRKNGGI